MNKKSALLSFIVVLIFYCCCDAQNSETLNSLISFESLYCENQINPIAIESEQPKLSWVVNATGFNKSQSAYQILVASHPTLLNEAQADLWNSQKVNSAQSTHVEYGGQMLNPTEKYWWKVRIWDENNQVSDWSIAQSFEMGLMNTGNWNNARWISVGKDTRTSEHRFREYKTSKMDSPSLVTSQPTGYFRNTLTPTKEITKARAYICGLGYYELYLNGKKVGDHVLDPAPSNYDQQAYYVSYDITDHIKVKENAVGIILGNGFYGQNISWKSDPESESDLSFGIPAVRLLIKLSYRDGSEEDFYTDQDWRVTTGPIVFDNIYGGDTYDARYEMNGWTIADYDDGNWTNVKIIQPEISKISAQQIPPIRRLQEFSAQRIFQSPRGSWIIDFGQNIAGWVNITVNEKEGQVINIITTEALTQDGLDVFPGSTGGGANGMKQLLTYVCKGDGPETWEPKFSYHGFRYAEISGLTSMPDKNTIKAILVANDIDQKGSFYCSDPLLNRMDTISRWTIVSNLHGIPEDCPHREKCGWLGDAHAFCEYALYNYELKNFYEKYMEDIRTQMRPVAGKNNPEKKFNVPTMIAPGKRTSTIAKLDWGIATMYLPWYNYKYYGDSSILTEYYEEMKGLTDYYLSFKNEEGIIDNGMGDWCPPRWDRRNNPSAMECDPVTSANAYFYDILGTMEHIALVNNDEPFKAKMQMEKISLFNAFNDAYLIDIPDTDHHWYGSQTATVMALQFGLVQEAKIGQVVHGLEYDINNIKGGHHSTGIHGNRYIYTVLSKYGKTNLAHDILTEPTFPSQTYIMNYGFTTWPERQFEWDKVAELTNSLNHPMHSGFAAFFFETLGGIKSTFESPGYKVFNVDPIFPDHITHSAVKIPTPYGEIQNNWNKSGTQFSMRLKVPFNTTARVNVDDQDLRVLKINSETLSTFKEKYGALIDQDSNLILGSGEYLIEFK